MKSFLSFFAFLSLLLFADTISAARKDVGEYWRAEMEDQPMPEAIEGLVRIEVASSSNEKTNCHTPGSCEEKEEKIIVEDFERPRAKGDEKKSTFADDFEPRPNISAYGDDANLKREKSSSFAKDFEPRPNISAYGGDDADLKVEKESFTRDFEPEPHATFYYD
ncbi:hypothetical protein CRYUN_Cryun04dG0047200 [Craigia yunnanensis]